MDRPFVSEGGKECQGDIGKERESEGGQGQLCSHGLF